MKPAHILLAALVMLGVYASPARADEMFQPNAALLPLRKDQFALRVETQVPNPCYVAGAVKPGAPDNVRITSDVVPIRVVIKMRRGMCAQVVSKVRHNHRPIRLGGRTGKTKVMVFAMLDGKVVGTTSVDLPVKTPPPAPAPTQVSTADWYAWLNRMPPGPATFHVTGTVELPTPGFDAKLVVATPQGINPKDLILDLVITPKPGIWPQVVTRVSVRFDKTTDLYSSVLVREPDGDATQIQVEEVH